MATAFPDRDASDAFSIWPCWSDPADDEEMIAWAREFHEAMARYADGVYSNYLGGNELDRLEAAYGENLDRLVEVKTRWDPENVFAAAQALEPRG